MGLDLGGPGLMRLFRDVFGCEHSTGGDDDLIKFWLAMSGQCEEGGHAAVQRALWGVIEGRPYRCLNHGDADPRNVFNVPRRPVEPEPEPEPEHGACLPSNTP